MIGIVVTTIDPLAIRYRAGSFAGINPIDCHTDIENAVIETVGLVTGYPVGDVKQDIANKTYVVEVLENVAVILAVNVTTITKCSVVANPGGTLQLLEVNTATQTQKR